MALGASVAVANPIFTSGADDKSNDFNTLLNWTTNQNMYETSIENIDIQFEGNAYQAPTLSGTGNDTLLANIGKSAFKITSDKGLKIGANGTGNLKIRPNGGTSFTLDLSRATGTSLQGNLLIHSGEANRFNSTIDAIFGGDLDGNIAFGRNKATVTFLNDGTGITGNITTDSTTYGSNATINFNGASGKIGGEVNVTSAHRWKGANETLTINANSLSIGKGMKLGDNSASPRWVTTLNLSGQNNRIGKLVEKGTPTSRAIYLDNNSTLTINERDNKPFNLTIDGNVYLGNTGSAKFIVSAPNSDLRINGVIGEYSSAIQHTVNINVKTLNMNWYLYNPSTTDGITTITLNGGASNIAGSINTFGSAITRPNFTLNNTDKNTPTSLSIGTDPGAVNAQIGTLTATGENNIFSSNNGSSKNIITTVALGEADTTASGGNASKNGTLTLKTVNPLTIEDVVVNGAEGTFVIDSASKFPSIKKTTLKGNKTLTIDNKSTAQDSISIDAFTAIGDNNKFIIKSNGSSNTISALTLGTTTGTSADGTLNLNTAKALTITNLNVAHQSGTLNIDSASQGVVTIGTATLDGEKTLTLDNQGATQNLTISTLTLGKNANSRIIFNKELKIGKLLGAKDFTRNTELTFETKITKNEQSSGYTTGRLVVGGSNDDSIDNAKLNGTYIMAIRTERDEFDKINPDDIKYDENSNVKVATIKKHKEAGSSVEGASQEDLRNQGVIDLGDNTALTFTGDLTLKSFKYHVAETNEAGASQANGGYITYFLNGQGEIRTGIRERIFSNLALSSTELYLANFNSLSKRMGELRDNAHSQGAWGRVFNGLQSNDINLKSSTSYTTIQAGYDYGFGLGEGTTNYLGFALSYGHSQSEFKSRANLAGTFASIDSLKSDLVEVALYNSYVQDNGWYNDTVAKFSYIFNQMGYSGEDAMGAFSKKGDINTYALTLSNEFGYRVKFGKNNEWYIDPQAELGFGYFNGKEFDFSGTKLGTMDSLFILRSRLGASFGHYFKNLAEEDLKTKLYFGLFSEMDFFNGGDVKFKAGSAQWAINTDARVVVNLGSNFEIKDNARVYVDFETSFGGRITTNYKINAGVRYSFGEKMDYSDLKDIKPMQVKGTPMKLKEEGKETK